MMHEGYRSSMGITNGKDEYGPLRANFRGPPYPLRKLPLGGYINSGLRYRYLLVLSCHLDLILTHPYNGYKRYLYIG